GSGPGGGGVAPERSAGAGGAGRRRPDLLHPGGGGGPGALAPARGERGSLEACRRRRRGRDDERGARDERAECDGCEQGACGMSQQAMARQRERAEDGARDLSAEVVRGREGFLALEADWNRLAGEDGRGLPFLRHEFFRLWLER